MALSGTNLASAIRAGISWDDGYAIAKTLADGLRAALVNFDQQDFSSGVGSADLSQNAFLQAIEPDTLASIKQTLNDELAGAFALQAECSSQPDMSAAMDPSWREILNGRVQTASSAIALTDNIFHGSILPDVSSAITDTFGDVAGKIAEAASKVVGNTLAGLWWVIALALGALYLWSRVGKGART